VSGQERAHRSEEGSAPRPRTGAPVTGPSPWADPTTPTVAGAPYAGPPPTTPPYAFPPPGFAAPYGQAVPYGYPAPYGHAVPWGAVPSRRPQRPGQVVTAAVLAFVQAVVVLIASLYLWFLASLADAAIDEAGAAYSPTVVNAAANQGAELAAIQLVSAAALVAAGVGVLRSRRRPAWLLLVAALAAQLVLAWFWTQRLDSLIGGLGRVDGVILGLSLFFAVGPLVGLGMLLSGAGRRWFDGARPR
jgi:hypothetical protein